MLPIMACPTHVPTKPMTAQAALQHHSCFLKAADYWLNLPSSMTRIALSQVLSNELSCTLSTEHITNKALSRMKAHNSACLLVAFIVFVEGPQDAV